MKTQCPHCKARFNVNDKFEGKQAKCLKCAKPFTIEPLTETPAAVVPPAASPKPVETLVKKPEPAAPPAQSPQPTTHPAPAAPPAQKAEPVAPPSKTVEQVPMPAKRVEPIPPPVKTTEPSEQKQPRTKGLSKIVFVYSWIVVRIIAGVLGGLGLMLAIRKEAQSTVLMTFAAADVLLVCSVVIELMLFYRMWAAIAGNQASITPAKAVALLFIPVFNIYWALCMLTGFVEDYNSFKQRRSVKTKDLSFALFLVYAFAFILSAMVVTLPMVCVFAFVRLISRAFAGYPESAWILFGFVAAAGVIHFIMYILFATKTCNAVNAISQR
jgi:predicted Zn finger-like uncharacterized protein